MLLNIVLIPMTATASAVELFENASKKGINWGEMLAQNIMSEQFMTIKFIIQLTFITNGVAMMDAAHKATVWIMDWLHRRSQSESDHKSAFVDQTQFPLGFNQSYVMVVFIDALLFAQLAPLIPFFASAYFYVKYLVDKNNLLFVYCHKYESGGQIRKSTRFLMISNLYIYLFATTSFFALKFKGVFYNYSGLVVIIVWTYLLYKVLTVNIFKGSAGRVDAKYGEKEAVEEVEVLTDERRD